MEPRFLCRNDSHFTTIITLKDLLLFLLLCTGIRCSLSSYRVTRPNIIEEYGSSNPNSLKLFNSSKDFLARKVFLINNGTIESSARAQQSWHQEVEITVRGFVFLNASNADVSEDVGTGHVVFSFGGSLLASCVLLFPCLRGRKRSNNKDTSSKGTPGYSTSNSFGESSFGGSSSSSAYSSSSSKQLLSQCRGGREFTLDELSKATKKFSPSCKIGQGGFGIVYKGKLKDGTIVAIKRAKKRVYDKRLSTEFDNEVRIFLGIDHLNLVKMIGCLDESDERLLVVEYVPNGNLREHLDGIHGVTLDLPMRLDICIDVAHALTYLHMYAGKPIIHRDVKSTNILLTDKFRAKVSDFGYSRMGPIAVGETHVSTEVKGTTGYLDPEYLKTFQLTEKSDVYSFGIVLIEITTGRRPVDESKEMRERVALRWAFRKFLDGNTNEILDPKLERTNASLKVTHRLCELAFQCTAPTKQDRPSMKEVGEVLWSIRKDFISSLEDQKLSMKSD